MNKAIKVTIVGAAALLVAAVGIAKSVPYWFAPKMDNPPTVNIHDPELIAKGEYYARVADCVACHTAPGGKPFAGGLGMQTPLGAIYSTNITPDPETGIGNYSYADFERAVRRGVRPDNVSLYPAMPSVSYMIAKDDEIEAMYAYFMSAVEPVRQDNQASTIPWPANMRWPLAWWQLIFAQPREFAEDPTLTAQQNHGAYLVEGLAHCGACHTPRGIGFQEKSLSNRDSEQFLAGSVLEGWYAKSLRNEGVGLAIWSEDEIVEFLRTGRTHHTAAFGSMSDVVEKSTQYFTDEDLQAIASFLKTLQPRSGYAVDWQPNDDTTTAKLRSGNITEPGEIIYIQECATCHRLDGKGAPRVFPALAGNSIVFAEDPSSLIQVTLAGAKMADTKYDMMAFTMPGFYHLSNQDLADVLNFIRTGWGNHGSTISTRDIARMRRVVDHAPEHYVPQAAIREGAHHE
ncbi:alcohol dehydrogenase [Aliidiomarina taiwanensis]|uniref:Alcohol dehydrogenase n=1 Tax=Aliidiomarina taiwanensis TaxID=946228 RepID=A0A432WW63_9GAMM|nr:cytochrome c [Aliidiomarina taiwanensis]RUO38008.1 alcohol dehydrogenase [Aliidiomarina taiwanensis]